MPDEITDIVELNQLLTTAEELAGMGCWRLEMSTRRGMWSDGMYRIHGYRPRTVQPSFDLVLQHVHEDDRDMVRRVLDTVRDRPQEVPDMGISCEYRVVREDGTVREVRLRGSVAEDPVLGWHWTGVMQDLTDQRTTERELQAHYALGQALRDWQSAEEGLVSLLRRLATALDYHVGTMWLWDEQAEELRMRAFWAADGLDAAAFEADTAAGSMRAGQGVPGRVFATGVAAAAEDVRRYLPQPRRDSAAELGLRAAVAFPVPAGDEMLAVVAFYAFDPRTPRENTLVALTNIGRELGRFLAARRAQLVPQQITAREVEVLQLAAEGLSGPQIAERLFVSPSTVKTHFEHVYEKLGTGDRASAVARALRTGLIS